MAQSSGYKFSCVQMSEPKVDPCLYPCTGQNSVWDTFIATPLLSGINCLDISRLLETQHLDCTTERTGCLGISVLVYLSVASSFLQ